jgi:hypothetical protein
MSDTELPKSTGYEASDVDPRRLLLWVAGLVAVLVLSAVASVLLFDALARRAERLDPKFSPLAPLQNPPPPEPRLLQNEPDDLATVRKEEDQLLHSYDWIDKDHGVVRIPIERALELLSKEGLPSRSSSPRSP